MWSGKRDSNSRPRPWQGRALPAELFPLGVAWYWWAIIVMVAECVNTVFLFFITVCSLFGAYLLKIYFDLFLTLIVLRLG